MCNELARRAVLKAAAGSGIAVSVAGCSGFLGDNESACDACETFLEALGDEEYGAAAEYLPGEDVPFVEYTDEYESDAEATAESMAEANLPDAEIESVSCECSESVYDEEEHDEELEEAEDDRKEMEALVDEGELEAEVLEDFDATIELLEGLEDERHLRMEVAYEDDDEERTESVYMTAVDLDGDWLVSIANESDVEACAGEDD
ncbi:hypothetical protein ACFQGT_13430 [Natrialbaceae archaeon GCM10025810]|uniref:hypothetical protein n=1 Tax=Halovalidus salilacus TaxID=3075124 RepID=UPI003615E639